MNNLPRVFTHYRIQYCFTRLRASQYKIFNSVVSIS